MARIEDSMGITYRQLDHWSKEGYLQPEGGNGTQRSWPEQEIKIGRMMSHLVAVGMRPEMAAVYARAAVVDKQPMVLGFEDGKLIARGSFSRVIRENIRRKRGSRSDALDSQEKAC